MMQIWRCPSWGFYYQTAEYWGWRRCVQIGPWLILWGMME